MWIGVKVEYPRNKELKAVEDGRKDKPEGRGRRGDPTRTEGLPRLRT